MSIFDVGRRPFRILALLEGTALLVLVGIAMPLRHFAHIDSATRVCGMTHGMLCLMYQIAIFESLATKRLSVHRVVAGSLSALVPFGTFVFSARCRRWLAEETAVPRAPESEPRDLLPLAQGALGGPR
jgi:integral membrane protein